MQLTHRETLIFGVLNITPDSFSDGALENLNPEFNLKKAGEIITNGANVLDIGAESTRPGASEITVSEELARLIPTLRAIRSLNNQLSTIPISIDTRKSAVAREALKYGIQYINDVSGLQGDPEMAAIIAEYNQDPIDVVIMHSRGGIPPSIRAIDVPDDFYDDEGGLLESMRKFFARSIAIAEQAGIDRSSLILDPGLGFGKNPKQSLEILDLIVELKKYFGLRILVGASRKSFLSHLGLTSEDYNELALSRGADMLRIHL